MHLLQEAMQFFMLLLTVGLLFSAGNCSCEDTDDTQYSDVCHEIFQSLGNALIQDKGNFYRLRKAFFYAPDADPVLLRIEYNITFAENITEDVLPYCINEGNSSALNETNIIHGWTSRGLYQWIEPLFLNRMQLAIPFRLLRLIREQSDVRRNPEMDAFLWDGSFDLPTLLINLNVTFLPCIPSKDIFTSTIEDLTTLVSCQPVGGSSKARPNQLCSILTSTCILLLLYTYDLFGQITC